MAGSREGASKDERLVLGLQKQNASNFNSHSKAFHSLESTINYVECLKMNTSSFLSWLLTFEMETLVYSRLSDWLH